VENLFFLFFIKGIKNNITINENNANTPPNFLGIERKTA
jgi:hypothetical protein